MSKAILIIDKPEHCFECPLYDDELCRYKKALCEQRKYCPLKPYEEAIPIEWIKNKIAVNMHLWEEGKDKMFIENGVVEVVSYSLTAQTLSKLLELWGKEYER